MRKAEAIAQLESVAAEMRATHAKLLSAFMMKEALERENQNLRKKVERMFDWSCKASVALDNQDYEHAVDCIERAKLAANS